MAVPSFRHRTVLHLLHLRRIVKGKHSTLGPRWFREAGGMAPIDLAPHSGRYLSFSEREEIALLWAQDCSVRAATVAANDFTRATP